ncbi:MAG: enoyl-CoA hydratase-related protein [bacterium]
MIKNFNKISSDLILDDQVLVLTLNSPKANVLDIEMISELTLAVQESGSKPTVKAIIFQGAGEHFSYGASVPEHTRELAGHMLSAFHQFFRILIEVSKPTVAVVRGQCLGGGLELAAFCNWIFASDDARLGQPEVKLGVFPPVASLILPHRIGQSAADDLVLTGRSISARDAKELGLVSGISDDPRRAAEEFLATHIIPKSSVALKLAVKSSRFEMHQAFLRNIDRVEKMYVQELLQSDDANEGVNAFLEKRQPVWKNR